LKKTAFFPMVFLISLTLHSQIKNDDRPQKGDWDFKLEKIWEIDKAGNNEFERIAELLVSDNDHGNIYVRDFKHNKSCIFNENGQYLGSFAKQGPGKGELTRYLNRFSAENNIVLGTPEKLNFYSEDGIFVRSYENNIFLRFPLLFLNKDEFIYAPPLPKSPVNQKKLMQYNLDSGEDKLVLDFSQTTNTTEANIPAPMIMIFGLTPQIRLASDKEKIYFGRSDQYTLFVADLKGNMDFSFSLDRKKNDVTKEDKKNHFLGSKIPQDRIDSLIKQLPDKMTYFSQIKIVDGLIYVYAVTDIGRTKSQQIIDIFSNAGKYLYQGVLKFGDDLKFGSPSNLVINNNFVYVILESQKGRQTLAKYGILLPKI
jgi:hypothetical protein